MLATLIFFYLIIFWGYIFALLFFLVMFWWIRRMGIGFS
uniref:Uncharacterized protein n=1 Tax=Rhizophora mucronata TaxID=61149 RepID=A0A2P2IL35_RHIMU